MKLDRVIVMAAAAVLGYWFVQSFKTAPAPQLSRAAWNPLNAALVTAGNDGTGIYQAEGIEV